MFKPFNLFGAYSEGTLNPRDLIPAAINAAEDVAKWLGEMPDDLAAAIEEARGADTDGDDCFEIYGELVDVIDCHLPAYVYFGSDEGDGAYIGFLLAWSNIEDDRRGGEIAAMDDEGEVEDAEANTALHVNDHGNATMYFRDGDAWREAWSVV